jgi:hypothetical protein
VLKIIGAVAGAAIALSIATPAGASSSGPDPAALDKAIAIQSGDHLAGVVALARANGGLWQGSTADAVTGRPIAPNSEFRIGSEQAGDASSLISAPQDIDGFVAALFAGKPLPDKELREMLTVPAVPYADSSNCVAGANPGRACFGLGVPRCVSRPRWEFDCNSR